MAAIETGWLAPRVIDGSWTNAAVRAPFDAPSAMTYDYARLFDVILTTVSSSSTPAERMHSLIAECERQRPHPDWKRR